MKDQIDNSKDILLTSGLGDPTDEKNIDRLIFYFQYGLYIMNEEIPIIPDSNCSDHLKRRIFEAAGKLAELFYTGSSDIFNPYPIEEYIHTRKEYAKLLSINEKTVDKVVKTLINANAITSTRKNSIRGTKVITPNLKRLNEIKNRGYKAYKNSIEMNNFQTGQI